MPSIVQELSGRRELGGLRTVDRLGDCETLAQTSDLARHRLAPLHPVPGIALRAVAGGPVANGLAPHW
ncbi:hypothetical protein ACE1SV_64380 [Streptomyces sp. E-15]